MTSAPARCFVFTHQFDSRDDCVAFAWSAVNALSVEPELHEVNQLIINCEEGTHVHGQCAIWLRVSKRFNYVKDLLLLPAVHYEIMRSEEASERYHSKEETAFDHYEWVRDGFKARGKKNKDSDSSAAKSADLFAYITELAETRLFNWKTLAARSFPLLYAKNARACADLYSALTAEARRMETVELRPWQSEVISLLAVPADGRRIIYVYDAAGNKGKTWLAGYLVANHNAIILDGRVQDMAYAWNGQPVVCMDIARSQTENMNHLYTFAEKVASGKLFSSKYESCYKDYAPPHVIMFSNVRYDPAAFTAGRVVEIDLAVPAVTTQTANLFARFS
jgi:hypothetical protein